MMIRLINLPKVTRCVSRGGGRIRIQEPPSQLQGPTAPELFSCPCSFPLPNHTSTAGSREAWVGSPPIPCRVLHLAFPEQKRSLSSVGTSCPQWFSPALGRLGEATSCRQGEGQCLSAPHPCCPSGPLGVFSRLSHLNPLLRVSLGSGEACSPAQPRAVRTARWQCRSLGACSGPRAGGLCWPLPPTPRPRTEAASGRDSQGREVGPLARSRPGAARSSTWGSIVGKLRAPGFHPAHGEERVGGKASASSVYV